jgi:hypothetical protein
MKSLCTLVYFRLYRCFWYVRNFILLSANSFLQVISRDPTVPFSMRLLTLLTLFVALSTSCIDLPNAHSIQNIFGASDRLLHRSWDNIRLWWANLLLGAVLSMKGFSNLIICFWHCRLRPHGIGRERKQKTWVRIACDPKQQTTVKEHTLHESHNTKRSWKNPFDWIPRTRIW